MKTIRLKLLMMMSVLGIALPITSQAYDFKYDGICYNILSEEDRTVEVTYVNSGIDNKNYVKGHVSIPQKVIYNSKSYSVTAIGNSAFNNCQGLTSVDIPSWVTVIGNSAFNNCQGLTSVDIPSSVTAIGNSAFYGCSGLTSVDIPSSVIKIGDGAFRNCKELSIINVQQDNPNYGSVEGILYSKKEDVVASLVQCPERKKGIIKIPSSVTAIEDCAFADCSGLTSVEIPSSVTAIGDRAFDGCSGLTSVVIGSSVTTIGYRVFANCSGLTSVEIPSSVTAIGYEAFRGCYGLTSVVIGSSVTAIGYMAFYCCSGLTSVDIPSSVTTIGDRAFYGCDGLTSVEIPSSVTAIGSGAFYYSELEKIYCHWEKPIKFDSKIFDDKKLMNTILYVPIGTKAEYEKVDPWRNFWNIEEGDYEATSGIKDVVGSEESTLEETDRFDVSGKPVSKDYKGMVIIRYSDGSIRKQIVK